MDKRMQALFERMKPYVEPHDYFDLVQTKFGLLQIFNPEDAETVYEVIGSYDDLLRLIFIEISGDVREESGLLHEHIDLHLSEAEETVRRVFPFIKGLQDDGYAERKLRRYIKERIG